jgi:hypothetical protein
LGGAGIDVPLPATGSLAVTASITLLIYVGCVGGTGATGFTGAGAGGGGCEPGGAGGNGLGGGGGGDGGSSDGNGNSGGGGGGGLAGGGGGDGPPTGTTGAGGVGRLLVQLDHGDHREPDRLHDGRIELRVRIVRLLSGLSPIEQPEATGSSRAMRRPRRR